MKKSGVSIVVAALILISMPLQSIYAQTEGNVGDDPVTEVDVEPSVGEQKVENADVETNEQANTLDVYNKEQGVNSLDDTQALSQITGSSISDIQVGELGRNAEYPGSSAIFIYVFGGESLDIEIKRDGRVGTNANGVIKLIGMDGIVVDQGDFDGTILDPTRLSMPASNNQGLYALVFEDTSGNGSGGSGSTLTFQILDANGELQTGRVFSKKWSLEQNGTLIDNEKDRHFLHTSDIEMYHRTSDGYLYKQEMTEFNGLYSTISSDGIGIVNKETCAPIPGDAKADSAKYPALIFDPQIQTACNLGLESNNIFFEMPDSKLPANAISPFGEKINVNPKLEDRMQSFSDIEYHKTSPYEHGGTFEFESKNVQSFVDVKINISENGQFSDTKTIERSVWVSNVSNKAKVVWDGKYSDGTAVPNYASVSVDVELKTAGEIHFVLDDVEMKGSTTVTRLNGYGSEDVNRLYYDASTWYFPIDWSRAGGFFGNITHGVTSYDSLLNPKQHSWDYIRPVFDSGIVVPGQEGTWAPLLTDSEVIDYQSYVPGAQDTSMGDGAYIHDWTYENVNIKKTSTFTGQVSKLDLVLQGQSTNPSGFVEKGDDVNYKIIVTNNGDGFASNVKIKDTLESILKYVDNPSKNEVKIIVDGKTQKYTVKELMDGIVIPILDAGKSVEVEFSVRAKSKLPASYDKLDFNNDATAKAQCAEGDIYNACNELYASSKLILKIPGNPGLEIDDDNSINGGNNNSGNNNSGNQNGGNHSNKEGWFWKDGKWTFIGENKKPVKEQKKASQDSNTNVVTGVENQNFTVVAGISLALICTLLVIRHKQKEH